MLELLVPLGLLGLATLLLPLLLHLWRAPRRTVRLGSLRFLNAQPDPPRRALRWKQPWLLLLRLLVLGLLAGMLAWPRWQASRIRPVLWVLVAPGTAITEKARAEWRQALADGAEVHRLSPGFPRIRATTTEPFPETGPDGSAQPEDVWSLLREADASLTTGSTLTVFAPASLRRLRGDRPSLVHAQVRWVETADAPPRADWIESPTWAEGGKRVSGWIGSSDPAATLHARFTVPAVPGVYEVPGASLEISATGKEVRLAGPEAGRWIALNAEQPLRVIVLHGPDREEDARFVSAAIRAVAGASGREIVVEENPPPGDPRVADARWFFQLGAQPLPPEVGVAVGERGAILFSDLGNEAETVSTDTGVSVLSEANGVGALAGPVPIWRRGAVRTEAGATVWTDGGGEPLLTVSPMGHGWHWQFQSRIHPAWTDWPLGTIFPAWIRGALFGGVDDDSSRDRRIAGETQARPTSVPSASVPVSPRSLDLRLACALFAAALFLTERFLSLRGVKNSPPRGAAP